MVGGIVVIVILAISVRGFCWLVISIAHNTGKEKCNYRDGWGTRSCIRSQEFGNFCRYHTVDKVGAEPLIRKSRRRKFIGLVVISCAAAWAIWGWKAAQQREKERTIAACRSYVAEYERFRASSQQISIPLTFTGPQGTSFSEQDVKNAYLAQRALNGKGAEIALSHRRCFFSFLIDQAKAVKDTPTVDHEVLVTMPRAGGCQDGWLSPSIGKRGACSHHGGVVAARPWAKLHYSDHLSGRLKGLPIPLAEAADPRIVIEHDDLD